MSGVSSGGVPVCALTQLDDPGAFGFALPGGGEAFVVLRGGALRAYRNRCPHMGNRLDWAPHRFLNRAGDRILCAVHGAVFEPETGLCVGGPCPGRSLEAIRGEGNAGQIVVYPACVG